MKEYKRQYRELEDATKQKISQNSKNKPKSETHLLNSFYCTGLCWTLLSKWLQLFLF